VSKGKSALGIVRKYHPQVNRVVDAKKPITIEVTAKDCRSGKSGKASSCAMARAFEREYDGAIVSLSTAYIIKGDKATRYQVPQSVSREIVSFDRSHKFEPGEYALNAPSHYKLGQKRKSPQTESRAGGNAYAATKNRNHKTAGIRAL
jgi:hypothetical protein